MSGTISSVLWTLLKFHARVPSKNVAEDIRTKFSREWWALCREEVYRNTFYLLQVIIMRRRNLQNFSALMEGSGEVLVKARDMKNRGESLLKT